MDYKAQKSLYETEGKLVLTIFSHYLNTVSRTNFDCCDVLFLILEIADPIHFCRVVNVVSTASLVTSR